MDLGAFADTCMHYERILKANLTNDRAIEQEDDILMMKSRPVLAQLPKHEMADHYEVYYEHP